MRLETAALGKAPPKCTFRKVSRLVDVISSSAAYNAGKNFARVLLNMMYCRLKDPMQVLIFPSVILAGSCPALGDNRVLLGLFRLSIILFT